MRLVCRGIQQFAHALGGFDFDVNVTDYELYVDNNSDSLILEFPWQSGETEFDPEAAIEEIGTTAYLTFREGSSADGELVLDGSMVESAAAQRCV